MRARRGETLSHCRVRRGKTFSALQGKKVFQYPKIGVRGEPVFAERGEGSMRKKKSRPFLKVEEVAHKKKKGSGKCVHHRPGSSLSIMRMTREGFLNKEKRKTVWRSHFLDLGGKRLAFQVDRQNSSGREGGRSF